MKKTLKGTGIVLTGEIRDYLEEKLKVLDKFVDPADDSAVLDVEIARTSEHHKNGNIFMAEVTLTLAGKQFRSEAHAESVHAAIDIVESQISMELRKSKSKERGFVRRSGAKLKDAMRGVRNWRF